MRAARDERNVLTGGRLRCTKRSTYAPGTDDSDAHRVLPSVLNRPQCLRYRIGTA